MKEFEGKVSFAQHLSPGSFDLPKVLRLGEEIFLGWPSLKVLDLFSFSMLKLTSFGPS